MTEWLMLVDENDNFTGEYATREECHSGNGKHHRAFVIILFDKNKKILLQKRRSKLWDRLWDLTASHTLHYKDYDESYEGAASRCLRNEWGIEAQPEKRFGFNYSAKFSKNCENEYCAVLVAGYNGELNPNPKYIYNFKWIKFNDLVKQITKAPKDFTPWTVKAIEEIQKSLKGELL